MVGHSHQNYGAAQKLVDQEHGYGCFTEDFSSGFPRPVVNRKAGFQISLAGGFEIVQGATCLICLGGDHG